MGDPGEHAELGEQLLWFALVLLIAVTALVAALACGVPVYRVGDSGARAAWGDATAAPAPR